jgi:hypothetical protein
METSGQVFSGGEARTVLRATASPASIADNAIVAAVTGLKIRVLAAYVHASGGANTLTWKSAATSLSGAIDLGNDLGIPWNYNPVGWYETVAGEALNLALTAATAVAVTVVYITTI